MFRNVLHIMVRGEWRLIPGAEFDTLEDARLAARLYENAHRLNFPGVEAYVATDHP